MLQLKLLNKTSQIRFQTCKTVRKKKLIRKKKSKETVVVVGDSMIKKIGGYLFTKSINHKFLVNVKPFTTAKTIDMYDHLKPTLRDFSLGLFIIHVGSNDLLLNKTSK